MKLVASFTFLLTFITICAHCRLLLQPEDQGAKEICSPTTAISEDHLKNVIADVSNGVSKTRQTYCRIACLFKLTKGLDDDNKFNITVVDRIFKRPKSEENSIYERVHKTIMLCVPRVMLDKDECNMAEQLMLCSRNLLSNHTNVDNIAKDYRKP